MTTTMTKQVGSNATWTRLPTIPLRDLGGWNANLVKYRLDSGRRIVNRLPKVVVMTGGRRWNVSATQDTGLRPIRYIVGIQTLSS